MKRKEFLQDAIGLIDQEYIKDAREESIKKRIPLLRIAAIAATFAIFTAIIPIGFMIADRMTPPIEGTESEIENNSEEKNPQYDENGREIWLDNRKYKDGLDPVGNEGVYEWSWEYLDMHEKYWLIDVDGKNSDYCFINIKVPEELLDKFIGNMIAYGYDEGSGERHEINCSAYSIKGSPDNDAIAVKLDGTDEYWIYHIRKFEYQSPENLGELISLKNLTETYQFLIFRYDHDNDRTNADLNLALSQQCSDHIWSILEKCKDAEFMGNSINKDRGLEYVHFYNTSIPLGTQGVSITIYENGVLCTNVLRHKYAYFFIGKDVATEIIEYAHKNAQKTPESPDKWVAGTITEIGEDYFKINDAPMMENEEDGIEFTVRTTNIKILRYFKSGILKVGETAIVKYDGNIYADEPTVINGAHSINECWIFEGDAVIPE